MKASDIWKLLKDTIAEWQEDKVPLWAAGLAYSTIFSLAPLLLIAISIAGAVFGEEAARGEIVGQIQGLVGRDGAEVIQNMIQNTQKPGSGGTFATVFGVGTLLLGASWVFGQLQDALNTIWEVKPKPGKGIQSFLQSRFLSFAMVLVIGFLLLVSLVLSAALAAIGNFFGHLIPGYAILGQTLNFLISFGVVTLLFAAIYKFLPDVNVGWKNLWVGAAVTALLFTIGKFLIGLYLGNSSVSSTYGSAGSLVVVLVWVFYSAQILLLGAEFTQVYSRYRGTPIEPSLHAVSLRPEVKEKPQVPTHLEADRELPAPQHDTPAPSRRSGQSRYIQNAATLVGSIVAIAGVLRRPSHLRQSSNRRPQRRRRRH
jgi:membrane protein